MGWGEGSGADTECLQHLLCLHYSELVPKIFKEIDFKCKLKGKCSQKVPASAFLLVPTVHGPSTVTVPSLGSHSMSLGLVHEMPGFWLLLC